jgi:hypothetical protein
MAGTLTDAQKQIFREQGYLCPLRAMDEAVLERFEAAHGGFGRVADRDSRPEWCA